MSAVTAVRAGSGAGHVIELANGAHNCARIVLLHRMCINQEITTEEAKDFNDKELSIVVQNFIATGLL